MHYFVFLKVFPKTTYTLVRHEQAYELEQLTTGKYANARQELTISSGSVMFFEAWYRSGILVMAFHDLSFQFVMSEHNHSRCPQKHGRLLSPPHAQFPRQNF